MLYKRTIYSAYAFHCIRIISFAVCVELSALRRALTAIHYRTLATRMLHIANEKHKHQYFGSKRFRNFARSASDCSNFVKEKGYRLK